MRMTTSYCPPRMSLLLRKENTRERAGVHRAVLRMQRLRGREHWMCYNDWFTSIVVAVGKEGVLLSQVRLSFTVVTMYQEHSTVFFTVAEVTPSYLLENDLKAEWPESWMLRYTFQVARGCVLVDRRPTTFQILKTFMTKNKWGNDSMSRSKKQQRKKDMGQVKHSNHEQPCKQTGGTGWPSAVTHGQTMALTIDYK